MQTKTYFANSVPAALEVARQDLGEEALLVSSRPAPPQARQFGRLEVTFAWDPEATGEPLAGAAAPVQSQAYRPQSNQARETRSGSGSDMDEIRQQLAALRVAVGGLSLRRKTAGWPTGSSRQASPARWPLSLPPGRAAEPATRDATVVEEITSRIPVCASSGIPMPNESRTISVHRASRARQDNFAGEDRDELRAFAACAGPDLHSGRALRGGAGTNGPLRSDSRDAVAGL